MQWTVGTDQDGETLATGKGDDTPEECIAELVEHFITDIAPLSHPHWDEVRVVFWLEDWGWIMMYPADSRKENRIEIGMTQIFSSILFEETETLCEAEDAGEISEDESRRQYDNILVRLAGVVEAAARTSKMGDRIGRPGLPVRCFEAEELEPFREFTCT